MMNESDPNRQRNDVLAGQKAWHRLKELESGFHNLQETVPPHADEWWRSQYADWRLEIDRAKAQLGGSEENPRELTEQDEPAVHKTLDHLAEKLATAREELGSRTAAGRAKAS